MKNKGDILSIKGDSASYKGAENVIKNIINGIEDAVFPPACPICSKPRVIRGGKRLDICPWCYDNIKYVKEPTCIKCGKALEDNDRDYCTDCTKTRHLYDQAISLYEYSDGIKQSIYRFKYRNKREYADVYAAEIARISYTIIIYLKSILKIFNSFYVIKFLHRGCFLNTDNIILIDWYMEFL